MPRGVERCPHCASLKLVRIDQYDAIACKSCLRWLEGGCSDRSCEFCSKRPPTPNGVDWNDTRNTDYSP